MQTRIQKWGNSLGLRIPMQVAKQLKLHPGSPITIQVKDSQIIIESLKYDLKEMLKDINHENSRHQILEDEQQGKEEW